MVAKLLKLSLDLIPFILMAIATNAAHIHGGLSWIFPGILALGMLISRFL